MPPWEHQSQIRKSNSEDRAQKWFTPLSHALSSTVRFGSICHSKRSGHSSGRPTQVVQPVGPLISGAFTRWKHVRSRSSMENQRFQAFARFVSACKSKSHALATVICSCKSRSQALRARFARRKLRSPVSQVLFSQCMSSLQTMACWILRLQLVVPCFLARRRPSQPPCTGVAVLAHLRLL